MNLPTHPLAGMRLAIEQTLETAGVDRVCTIGRVDPLVRDILTRFERSGGVLEMLDCACGASAFPMRSGSCVWILPAVANYYHAYQLLHGIRSHNGHKNTETSTGSPTALKPIVLRVWQSIPNQSQ